MLGQIKSGVRFKQDQRAFGCPSRGDLIHPAEMMGGGSRDGFTTSSGMAADQHRVQDTGSVIRMPSSHQRCEDVS